MGNRWGPAGPPDEAYSRVTDPQRYAPLHAIARDVLDDLQRRFDVTARASSELDPNKTTPAPVTTLYRTTRRARRSASRSPFFPASW
jgi:hypothetical protein